ncbi:MAG: thioredoxin domain-containing protein [Aquificaceae bacterium]
MLNRLVNSKSPYLQKSAHQPVDWYEWSSESFRKAGEEDKPILLSIGGVWCHWCHVMAHESFENPEIARIINEHFIAIKVDRDERPDIDRRYQEVVVALTKSGGWPLTVFLTPEGKAFFGGTYFPPEDRWGRPGFKSLLLRIAQLWKEERERILRSAESIFEGLLNYSRQNFKDHVDEDLLERGISTLLASIDYQKGGIDSAPKFHHAKAFELLIYHNYFKPSPLLQKAITLSLDAMAKGGIYDHLLGGFFRYSTDDSWYIPHFEKMLYDNAELLSLYSIAYKLFGKELYKRTAHGILNYYRHYGYDQEGGFYASQDADVGLLDEGGYYTFTREEIEKLLTIEERSIFSLYFGLAPMPHEPHKGVLYLQKEEEENTTASIRVKLLEHREKREKPYIDKTIYTNWNALMVSALCDYHKVFGDKSSEQMAEKTLQRLLRENYKEGKVYHKEGVEALSEDYIFLAHALLSFFEIKQDRYYLEASKKLMEKAIDLFWDDRDWGFYDTKEGEEGLLKVRLKSLQDMPTQSANSLASYTLLLLGSITGDDSLISYGEKILQGFSRFMKEVPLASPSYFISLYAYLRGIYKIETRDFYGEALRLFRPFKFVIYAPVEGLVVCEGQSCNKLEDLNQILTQGN